MSAVKVSGIRALLPLYVVVFVGFLGYSLMIAVFTPMMLRNDGGMLPASGDPDPSAADGGLLRRRSV